MTVSFDLESADWATHRRSQLRLLIGDTAEGEGPRPMGANFDDAELDAFMALEAGNLQRGVALALETLAAQWSKVAGDYRLGPESEASRQAEAFAGRAKAAREKYGYALGEEDTQEESAVVDWSGGYKKWHSAWTG